MSMWCGPKPYSAVAATRVFSSEKVYLNRICSRKLQLRKHYYSTCSSFERWTWFKTYLSDRWIHMRVRSNRSSNSPVTVTRSPGEIKADSAIGTFDGTTLFIQLEAGCCTHRWSGQSLEPWWRISQQVYQRRVETSLGEQVIRGKTK